MPTALDREYTAATSDRAQSQRVQQTLSAAQDASSDKSEAAIRLMGLLFAAPFDLAAICDEIRSHSRLEELVTRLGSLLGTSPEAPISSVEEAVIVLGTDRLRVLIDLWSAGEVPSAEIDRAQERHAAGAALAPSSGTPEMQYLANFIRCLGLDSLDSPLPLAHPASGPSHISSNQMVALTDLFMRDFFSLLPVVQPNIREVGSSSTRG